MVHAFNNINKIKKNAELRRKLIRVCIYIILIPILMYNISTIIQHTFNTEKLPSFFGFKMHVITYKDMNPKLKIGDIAIVKKTKEEQIESGDIVLIKYGKNFIAKRINDKIIEKENTIYKTKSYNNNTADSGTITNKVIEGKIVCKIPYLGYIVLLLQKKKSMIFLIIFYYFYLVYNEYVDRKKAKRKRKKIRYQKEIYNEKEKR